MWARSPQTADRWFKLVRNEPNLIASWTQDGEDWTAFLAPEFERYAAAGSVDRYLAMTGQSAVPPNLTNSTAETDGSSSVVDFMTQYLTDTPTGPDLLNVEAEAAAIAKIIALRRTEPPLSVGLFGDWGTGKTFFIRKIRQHVELLAARTREARELGRSSAYCENVVHVDFNAWHYIEHNLWASLVTRVFEVLFQDLGARAMAGRDAQSQIQLEAADQAKRNLEAAKAAAAQAAARGIVATAGQTSTDLDAAIKDLQANLGQTPDQLNVKELERLVESLSQTQGRLREGVRALPVAARRNVLLSAAVVLGLALLTAVVYVRFGNLGAGLAALLGPLAVISVFVIRATSAGLQAVNRIVANEQVKNARDELDAAKRKVDSAETEYRRIQAQQGQTVYRFIEERYLSSDYRKQLGIVALIQRDFETLSRRLRADGSGLPTVDRIVLYIDDLDRCPSELVVKVLQAVHLLLAFELFVVVVAVDSRWLLRSLEHRYRVEFGSERKDIDEADDGWSATPQNYLEKIFQIPYWVRPMDPTGYRHLVEGLVGSELPPVVTPIAPVPVNTSQPQDEIRSQPPAIAVASPTTTGSQQSPDARGPGPSGDADSRVEPTVDLHPREIEISPPEAAFLESLGTLIETPRAAKRLINLYRLLKVSMPPGTLESESVFSPVQLMLAILSGYPREASLMFPALKSTDKPNWWAFVDGLLPRPSARAGRYFNDVEQTITDREARTWSRLVEALEPFRPNSFLADLTPYQDFGSMVARYSFQAGRSLSGGQNPVSLKPAD